MAHMFRIWDKQVLCVNRLLEKTTLSRTISFFGRDKDDKHLDPEIQLPESLAPEKRKYRAGESTIKHNLNLLRSHDVLTTKKGYDPPSDVEVRIQKITQQTVDIPTNQSWKDLSLHEPRLKYKLLTKYMREFDHSVPNTTLDTMQTVDDAVNFFCTKVSTTHSLEDLTKLDLPKNLNIQTEYHRFNPETDTMFQGKTAFPGRNTHVTSIKYGQKYKGVNNCKEKTGYVNHYYGY